MRLLLSFLLILVLTCLSQAESIDKNNSLSLQTKQIDGKTVFIVDAGTFPNENSALQHKLSLATKVKQPVFIEPSSDKKLFMVKVGPLDSEEEARLVQKQLDTHFSLTAPTVEPLEPPSDNSSTVPPEQSQEKQLWNLRNADIRAVIGEVSRITGKNFIIDPRVQGKVSIVSSTPLSNKELYQVFLSVLQVSGYAAIPSGAVIKIIPNVDSKIIFDSSSSPFTNTDEMLVEVIPINYVPAEQLVPVLRPLMPQWSNIAAFTPSNRLILSGRANNIRKLISIIKQVDSPSAYGIDMVPLKHALAMDIANTLKDLIKPQAGGMTRSTTMVAADDRSNALLVSGSRTERLRLRILISRLDKESPYGSNSNTQVVYLNYLRAEDLAPILAGIAQANFSGTVGTTIGTITRPVLDSTNPSSSLANNSNSSATTSQAESTPTASAAASSTTGSVANQSEGSTKPTIQIIAEPNTNSIILSAPVNIIKTLKSVINQLDILPAQILIEALVAEVNENDVVSLGIEWGSNQQTGKVSGFKPGFAIINTQTQIDDFQAQIYALATQQKANILSTPSVVVLDNRQAKILVGSQVSVASTTYPNNAGGTTVASPYVTYDRVNVALHLYVRPQVTRGKGIQLQIDQGNDTLDPSYTPESGNPTFKISSIVTSVHVESGDIIVLGGLSQDSLGNDDRGLPILGSIPGIGRLFQHNVRRREKKVLMVFIRPILLRNEANAVQLSGGKYNNLRQYQLDWLRTQEYHKTNKDVVLPPIIKTELPRPFIPQPLASMTK